MKKLNLEEVEILDEATQDYLEITEGAIDSKKFDSLKRGDTMTITYNSTMSGTSKMKFVVKSKSRSAKYNTDKVTMYPDGNPNMARFFLYKRASGDVSMATGDMAASIMTVKENFQDWAEAAEDMQKKPKEDDAEKLKNQNDQKDNEIAMLKQKAETDKAKSIQKSTQKQVNPETGEERDEMSLYNFKLSGLISGKDESYITLTNTSGDVITLNLNQYLHSNLNNETIIVVHINVEVQVGLNYTLSIALNV